MSEKLILGIDTSNYTTSLAVVNTSGEILANLKQPLEVGQGERGLRQSDALFSHVKNLPILMRELGDVLGGEAPVAIGVSDKPRCVEGSYMPVFLAGVSAAESIASVTSVPLFRFSHQCGHIMAALSSSGRRDLIHKTFGAFHVSGGTTELLVAHGRPVGFDTEIVGGTLDLNAGQVVDRVGVMLGLPFPAGRHLEELALAYGGKPRKKKVAGDGMHVNFSGIENLAKSIYNETKSAGAVASFVFDYISRALIGMAEKFISVYGEMPLVFAGGVMSNSIIKNNIRQRFDAHFADPQLSADNAVGIALLAMDSFLNNQV